MVDFGDIRAWNPGAGQVTTWTASQASRALMSQAPYDAVGPSHQQAQHLQNVRRCAEQRMDMPRLLQDSAIEEVPTC